MDSAAGTAHFGRGPAPPTSRWREIGAACAAGWIGLTVFGSLLHLRRIVLRALRPHTATYP
jgi:hypothetical protein